MSRDKVKFEKYLAYMQGIVEQIIAPCVLEDGTVCYTSYRHSFCHGWSAGVIPYLMQTVVGVKTMGAGMERRSN